MKDLEWVNTEKENMGEKIIYNLELTGDYYGV
jgi:hypothetical protein